MRRYQFLSQDYVYSALNKLRAAFLAAKDGNEVEEIINGVLTHDERLKIGRRVEIAQMIESGLTYQEIAQQLKVGVNTVIMVAKKISDYPLCFKLINQREAKVENQYQQQAYKRTGSPKLMYKKKAYTGFKKKDVRR